MKRSLIALVFACLLLPASAFAQTPADGPRVTQLFNFGWKFQAGEVPGAEAIVFDDTAWRALDLPHDFQIEQPWDQAAGGARGFKAMGVGWYRKSFQADPLWKGRKVLLDFEGLMLFGEVWLNGQKVADIDYGYLGAQADVTKQLKFDGPNVVAVRASTGKPGQSRWYTGGGLFRDVHLIVKDNASIASDGVFVTTPLITDQSAQIGAQVELDGITGSRDNLQVEARIFAPNGTLVAESKTAAPQGSKLARATVTLPAAAVTAPKLWSVETPSLYTAKVTLLRDGKVIDQTSETFGIRTIEFSREAGLKLNGKKVFLKGVADHHDLGALGAAVYDGAIERLFTRLKAFGFNHVRTSHNPYSRSFMRLADKHGILIVDELTDKWSENDYWPGKKPFSQMWYKMIPDWIRRDRNHPSVIAWSLGNELQMREDLTGFPTDDWGVTPYKILDTLVKRYDPTRKTTVAMFPARANGVTRRDPDFTTNMTPPEMSLVTDIASYNYQYLAYPKYLEAAPNLIIYQSEATTAELLAPFFGMDREKMVGLAYWGAVEYWGESNGWPKKGWNFSFFDHALEPYPQAYLIKSAFVDTPLVHIGVVDSSAESLEWNDIQVGRTPISGHWNRTPGSKQNLFTYTNADEVELLVNGVSIGVQQNPRGDIQRRNSIYWKAVPYGQGGSIVAVARTAGKEVARQTVDTTGKAVALKLGVENAGWKAGGSDLQYVTVRAVDSKGRPVPTAQADLDIAVTGAATLIATDNGDHSSDALFGGTRRALHNGFAMAILRSQQRGGKVELKVSAPGLKGGSARMTVR